MSEENKQKCIEAIANTIINQLNINGIVEATKFYAFNLASNQYAEMSDGDKQIMLDNIEKKNTDEAEDKEKTDEPEEEAGEAEETPEEEAEEAPVEVVD